MNRVFVEKQTEFNSEAKGLLVDLQENLGLQSITATRVIQQYDVDGLSEREFDQATRIILSEPQIAAVTSELIINDNETAFAVEYLPGQFDQRAKQPKRPSEAHSRHDAASRSSIFERQWMHLPRARSCTLLGE